MVLMVYRLHAMICARMYDSDRSVSVQHTSVMHVYADHDSDKDVCEHDDSRLVV